MKTINNLMTDWDDASAKAHNEAYRFGRVPEYEELWESRDIYKELVSVVGGNFDLPANDFYSGLFTMIDTARQLKQEQYVTKALINLLYEYAPEDVNVDDLVHNIDMEYLKNHQRDK